MAKLEKNYKFKLSIITVNLNNKKGLQKTIDSVISQTCQDFEWIIIDGGSIDGSKDLIDKYQDHIDYWVSEPDKGIFNAMNKGIMTSNGEYLLFLNSGDCLYDENVIDKNINLLTDYDIYYGIEIRDNKLFDNKIRGLLDNEQILYIFTFSFFPHQSSFFKKSLFYQNGFYNENYSLAADEYFYFKVLILGEATIFGLSSIISIYEGGGVSTLKFEDYKRELRYFFNEKPRILYLLEFYKKNLEILKSIKKSNLSFFLFRIYLWFNRKIF